MRAVVLRALRRDARSWWYHARLRESGQVAEAREREAASVRGNVAGLRKALANGGWLSIGRGGASLYPARGEHWSGLHPGLVEAAKHVLPWVDTTTVPVERLGALVRLPMPEVGVEGVERFDAAAAQRMAPGMSGAFRGLAEGALGYGALDRVPFPVFARLAAELGATVEGVA